MTGATTSQAVNTSARLTKLRELMRAPEHNVGAVVVPSEDQHASEYLADCDARRAFISGFDGSAGCAVVTHNEALMFTDGRYFLQASKQLDSNWTLMKVGLKDVPTWQEYLAKHLAEDTRIGVDPTLLSIADADDLEKTLKDRRSTLVPLSKNLVDEVWTDRPARPTNPVFALDIRYTGKSSADKLADLRAYLKEKKYSAHVVSALDEIAWLFNLRGSDIAYNPVFFSYAVVTQDEAILFADIADAGVVPEGVTLRPYADFWQYLAELKLHVSSDLPVLLSPKTSLAVSNAVGRDKVKTARAPVTEAKAIKNPTEIEGFRQSHIRDGAALVRYFAWLDKQLASGTTITESEGADKLEEFRSKLELFKGLSFTTISSTGPNGAIIHYSPDPKDCAVIRQDQVYLCDSGAQFLDGTTDTTRTWHFGTPSDEERRAFTRVLQGHIAIDTAVFPEGTTGYKLDPFARRALWEDGLDFRHGTGHGVGHFLNVHEGPHGIGIRKAYDETALKEGMTVSNEPGYYADGRFGIRIEDIVIVQKAATPNNFGNVGYLKFERVTMCPKHRKLIETSLLSPAEKKWVDDYHAEVLAKVGPLLQGQEDATALEWLKSETQPL
ncbi:putative aminopeptidase P, cytoplasmic [Exidia glandulosa HHB12029]|uniref:Putative aminopeptidase P, cytoplasmic n=1 Tax=Exidia glandulosa HHB12029 TaxID=1314781 RepID=A0A165MR90_EXIGL|nr:putative aminopeptidase P, cytoplasmic [Exidia glandulosa HHB12029]